MITNEINDPGYRDGGHLLLVMDFSGEIQGSSDLGTAYGLDVHDFGRHFTVPSVFGQPPKFIAVSATGISPVNQPDIVRGHRFSRGSWWLTHNPNLYPSPPFLLTSDPSYRVIHHAGVSILPLGEAVETIQGECYHYGHSDVPILGDGWLGMVRVVRPDVDRGEFWAFSNRDVPLAGRIEGIRCADEDDGDEFGAIVIPAP